MCTLCCEAREGGKNNREGKETPTTLVYTRIKQAIVRDAVEVDKYLTKISAASASPPRRAYHRSQSDRTSPKQPTREQPVPCAPQGLSPPPSPVALTVPMRVHLRLDRCLHVLVVDSLNLTSETRARSVLVLFLRSGRRQETPICGVWRRRLRNWSVDGCVVDEASPSIPPRKEGDGRWW